MFEFVRLSLDFNLSLEIGRTRSKIYQEIFESDEAAFIKSLAKKKTKSSFHDERTNYNISLINISEDENIDNTNYQVASNEIEIVSAIFLFLVIARFVA